MRFEITTANGLRVRIADQILRFLLLQNVLNGESMTWNGQPDRWKTIASRPILFAAVTNPSLSDFAVESPTKMTRPSTFFGRYRHDETWPIMIFCSGHGSSVTCVMSCSGVAPLSFMPIFDVEKFNPTINTDATTRNDTTSFITFP